MGSASDFIIENGVVTKYIGPGGPVVTPAGIKSIGREAFRDCSNITSIKFSAGIKSIADDAFQGCSSLESIALPDSVTYIGCRAF